MAFVLKDRVKETSTSTGTGTITLAGAVPGYQSFSAIGTGNSTYYTIASSTQWEVGIGTYTASGTTLSRDTVLESSTGGTLVDFSAGTKDVFVTYPAERAVYTDAAGTAITPATDSVIGISSGGTGSNTASFSGANVTNLNASNISSGTLANARTTASSANGASTIVARDASGDFTGRNVSATNFVGTLNGSGSNVTNLNASNITSGILDIAEGGTGANTAAAGLSNLGGVTTGKAIAMSIVFGG